MAVSASGIINGDHTLSHVTTASILGGALSAVSIWGLQLAHLDPPASVDQAFTVIMTVIASYLMQKLGNQT